MESNLEATSQTSPKSLMKLKGFNKTELKTLLWITYSSKNSVAANIFIAESSEINGMERHYWD